MYGPQSLVRGPDHLSGPSWPQRCQGDGMEAIRANHDFQQGMPHSSNGGVGGSVAAPAGFPSSLGNLPPFPSKSSIPPFSALPSTPLATTTPSSPGSSSVPSLTHPLSLPLASTAGTFPSAIPTVTEQSRSAMPAARAELRASAALITPVSQGQASTIAALASRVSPQRPRRVPQAGTEHHDSSDVPTKASKGGGGSTPSPMRLEHLRSLSPEDECKDPTPGEQLKKVQREKAELTHQLEVQRKRNGELKRLLVASIGADLQERFDSLCHEKAESTETLSVREKELQLLRERVEHLAIQCDVYQSKYRASSVMIEELSSIQSDLQASLIESRGVIHQLLTEQRQVFGDLRFTYQQLSAGCQRLQDAMNTTAALPVMHELVAHGNNGAAGTLEITTELLSRHCSQLAAWCSNHLTGLLQVIRSGGPIPAGVSKADVGGRKAGVAAGGHLGQHPQQTLDDVQWRPSNAESVAHKAVLTALPHYAKARVAPSPVKPAAASPLGLSSTWITLNYSSYGGCSRCQGEIHTV